MSPPPKLIDGSGLFAGLLFHPLVPSLFETSKYLVRDFTSGVEGLPTLEEAGVAHDVGRYNERRRSMYATDLFGSADPWSESGNRDIHIGIDVGGPPGTPIFCVTDCKIHSCGYNEADGDYGHVIVTESELNGHRVFMLHGHLSAESTAGKKSGDKLSRGDWLGSFGAKHENGGWHPHVHFQLSLVEPATHDMPGVVSSAQHAEALATYPDPRQVLGPLYEGDGLFEA